jgi:hypothetical protein
LTWQAGISPSRAREVVRLAEARSTHPAVMSTFAAGALSLDQAAIATKLPPTCTPKNVNSSDSASR